MRSLRRKGGVSRSVSLMSFSSFAKNKNFNQHDRLNVEKRIADGSATQSGLVKTSDIARLMELFQVSTRGTL